MCLSVYSFPANVSIIVPLPRPCVGHCTLVLPMYSQLYPFPAQAVCGVDTLRRKQVDSTLVLSSFFFVSMDFSSIPSLDLLGRRGGGGTEGRFSRDPLPVFFSAGGTYEHFWRW